MNKRKRVEVNSFKKKQFTKNNNQKSKKGMTVTSSKHDIFDASEDYKENLNELRKFADVDVYDYDLPDKFEDEEIDEDEAFDDEDYEKFGNVFSKSGNKFAEEEEEEGDEYQNISDLLDAPEERSNKDEEENENQEEENSEEENIEEDNIEEEESEGISEEEEEIDDTKHQNMIDTISKLNRKRRKVVEVDEIVPESEWNLSSKGEKLSLQQVLGTLQDETGFGEVKKKLSSVKDDKKLSSPLPQVTLDRLERQVGYTSTSKDISQWQEFVQIMRKKNHVSFPLHQEKASSTNATMISTFEPETELEAEIENILKQNGLHENQLKGQDLELNKLTEQELQKRSSELAKLRSILFYQQQKAKRQKKIKSKSYHKMLKRQKERNKLPIEELMALDPEAAKEELERLERKRIEERMTQRHKKSSSKFSKTANMNNPETKSAVEEQLRIRDQLKQKMLSAEEEEEEEDNNNNNNNSNEEDEVDQQDDKTQQPQEVKEKPKGLYSMKFMQRSLHPENKDDYEEDEKDQKEERELTHHEILRLGNRNQSQEEEQESQDEPQQQQEEEEEPKKKKVQFAENGMLIENAAVSAGRKIKTTGPISIKLKNSKKNGNSQFSESKSSSEKSIDEEILLTPFGEESNTTSSNNRNERETVNDSENPWINSDATKTQHKKRDPKQNKGKKKQKENVVELDMKTTMSIVKSEGGFNLLADANKQQAELIERAFASSNVEEEFEQEKQAIADAEDAKEEEGDDGRLPGWGSWAGEGIAVSKKKKVVEKKEKKELDPKMKHVIITGKQMKQAEKYMVPNIPKPFNTKDQYERSMRTPIGKDWNTQTFFQKLTQPKIQTKAGIIIEPITREKANQELSEQPSRKKKENKTSLSGRKKG